MERKELEKLKKHLKKQLIDCLKLERKKDLTEEGEGQLALLKAIYEDMGWEIPHLNEEL